MAISSKLSTLNVSNAISRLTMEETRDLVFRNGVPLNVLKDIAAQYDGENRKQNYVQAWLDMDNDASWDKLVAGLSKINKNSLATEIESEHLSRVPVPSNTSPSLLSTSSVSVSATPPANTQGHQEAATPAPVGSLPSAPLTATPAPVGSLPPAPLTATPAPVGSLPPAPLTATPASVGPLPPAPLTATPAPVDSLPPAPLTATPAPVGSLPLPDQSSTVSQQKVEDIRDAIEHFEEEFSDVKHEAQESLSLKQSENPKFVRKFRNNLLDMSVTKKKVHIRFFSRNEDEILKTETIEKLFVILGRYCNYSNYEIIFHIVKRFCPQLKGRMLKYRDSLTSFEKSTTVDVYLCAISARPGGEIREGFIRMTMKINKPPSECTLYEIRELKESIEEKASLQSYAMYIETPEEGSVCVRILIPWEVYSLVSAVLTTEFREEHLLTNLMVKRWAVEKNYLVRTWNIKCMSLWTLESTGTVFSFPDVNMFELEKLAVTRLVVQPIVMHNHILALYVPVSVCVCVC